MKMRDKRRCIMERLKQIYYFGFSSQIVRGRGGVTEIERERGKENTECRGLSADSTDYCE